MGNCIERSKQSPEKDEHNKQSHDDDDDDEGDALKSERESGGMRVKIVLTKEELDWLLCQLKNTDGKRRLEDVLGEIQRSRDKAAGAGTTGWRPCLDSIVENPEAPEIMDR